MPLTSASTHVNLIFFVRRQHDVDQLAGEVVTAKFLRAQRCFLRRIARGCRTATSRDAAHRPSA